MSALSKKQIIEKLMKTAGDSADKYSDRCWSLHSDEIECLGDCYDSEKDLEKAVSKFVSWLLKK